jgi:hypothetical protein
VVRRKGDEKVLFSNNKDRRGGDVEDVVDQ